MLDCFGPLETPSVIVAPEAALVGSSETTVSAGWSLTTFVRLTPKPAFCSVALAWSNDWPMTFGTGTGCGPLETLICTFEPFCTFEPGCGNWPVTVSGGLPEWTETTV